MLRHLYLVCTVFRPRRAISGVETATASAVEGYKESIAAAKNSSAEAGDARADATTGPGNEPPGVPHAPAICNEGMPSKNRQTLDEGRDAGSH